MSPDPRETLRDLIAENEGKRRNGAASDGRGWFRSDADRMECFAVADAVMELFPEAGVEDWLIGTLPTYSGEVEIREQIRRPYMPVTHQRYVLRTAPVELPAPQPVEEIPHG